MDAPPVPPQVTLAAEHYNRLVRMLQAGEKLKMAVELEVEFHDNMMGYNTIAEIPGTDLKDQIVMLGGHLDSWHSGTGATDNGAGCAAVMEAVRIIKALDLHPRRTIRIALWTGEEQGLFGSKGYVTEHFGSYPESTTRSSGRRPTTRPSTSQPTRNLIKRAEYENLSVYFNLDNGTGRIRGVHLQGNEAARPIFRQWLAPFADLDALTITISNTGGTDHISFDAIGLPGFQFIQDPIEYLTRTHHSNMDLYDHASADDGFVLIRGAGIVRNDKPRSALAVDIVPTVLYIAGLPVARDMDGSVLSEAFSEELMRANPLSVVQTYEAQRLVVRRGAN